MQSIRNLYNRSRTFNSDTVLKEAVEETKGNIVELNKNQLLKGLSSNDLKIGEILGGVYGYKNAAYAFEKNLQNPLPGLGNPDLFKTGSFFAGIKIEIIGRRMLIGSSDSKNEILQSKYLNIFGLGPTAQKEYIKVFLQSVLNQKRINKLGL